jgi:predicted transcriptional regulator
MKKIKIDLTKEQIKKLEPFTQEVLRVWKAGSIINDNRLAIMGQVSMDFKCCTFALLTKKQAIRVRNIVMKEEK